MKIWVLEGSNVINELAHVKELISDKVKCAHLILRGEIIQCYFS